MKGGPETAEILLRSATSHWLAAKRKVVRDYEVHMMGGKCKHGNSIETGDVVLILVLKMQVHRPMMTY